MLAPRQSHRLRLAAGPHAIVFPAAAAFVLIGAMLWFGRGPFSFSGAMPLFALALAAVLVTTHRRLGDAWREVGFRLDTFTATLRLLAPYALVAAIATLGAALWLEQMHFPPLRRWLSATLALIAFGLLQQYALLGFFYRLLAGVLSVRAASLISALVFSVMHLPNPFLTVLCFIAGLIACAVYRRSPNLFANGLVHGLLSMLFLYSLPASITGGMRVGAQYLVLTP